MDSNLALMQKEFNTLNNRTNVRLEKFDSKLRQVEADTVWKITEYEKLLEMRP